MKLKCKFNRDYVALFSNVGSKKEDEFYLLMTFHKSKKGGFDHGITVEECQRLLRRRGYKYIEEP